MIARIVVVVLLCVALARATPQSAQQQGENLMSQLRSAGVCGAAGIDLSSLTLKTGATDYSYSDKDGHNTWYVNVCADTIANCQGDQTTSPAVWNYDFKQPYACFNLGAGSSGAWSQSEKAISIKYTNGDACYNVQPASAYTIQINFQCPASGDSVQTGLAGIVLGATQCDYVATFNTPLMCSYGGGSKVGVWVFNILVLAGLPLYFAAGYAYNTFALKLEGSERIPNHAFWSDLPALIKDGCLYFVYVLKLLASKVGLGESPVAPSPSASSDGYASAEGPGAPDATPYSYPPAASTGGGYGAI